MNVLLSWYLWPWGAVIATLFLLLPAFNGQHQINLPGNAVIDIGINQDHIVVGIYIFLSGGKLITHGVAFTDLPISRYANVYRDTK